MFVCAVSQTMWVQPCFLPLSSTSRLLLSAHSVPRMSLTVINNTDNALLHIIFDFSTIKGARVQMWGNVKRFDLHVRAKNAHIPAGNVCFMQMASC